MSELPERIKRLDITNGGAACGALLRESQYVFTYLRDDPQQPPVAALMPPSQLVWQDNDLFPPMDMNLPEGFLFQRLLELHPKQQLTKMHLLALMGDNGIGRIGYRLPEADARAAPATLSRERILASAADGEFFQALVDAYLSTGAGISGVQPKIMVPSRATLPIPDLIVKAAGADYPGLAANEFLCLDAARAAGLDVPRFELSHDGGILVLDRFDLTADGARLGFEDVASLMGKRVHDRLSNRKYDSSYEKVVELIRLVSSDLREDLARFFAQLALSVMVRNGDAHLKNFGFLYTGTGDLRLSPLFDVVTTAIYSHERAGLPPQPDRTLALKWRNGPRFASKAYPTTQELLEFGRSMCGVARPADVVERIADAMSDTLQAHRADPRIDPGLMQAMAEPWALGMAYGSELRAKPVAAR